MKCVPGGVGDWAGLLPFMGAGTGAFGQQVRLRVQPMLDIVSRLGTVIEISEIGSPGHFVRRRHKRGAVAL